MSIDHRASATQAYNAGATSRAVTVPASVATNDIAYAYLYIENNTVQTITPPSGYTELARETQTGTTPDYHIHVFWKRLAASEASTTHTFSWSTSSGCSLGMTVILEAITSGAPEDATKTFTIGPNNNTNLTAPDITPATQPHMEMSHASSFAGPASWTIPSGMTAYSFTSDTAANAYLRRTTTSAPGTRNHVVDALGRWTAGHVLLKEATASSIPPGLGPVVGDQLSTAHLVAMMR